LDGIDQVRRNRFGKGHDQVSIERCGDTRERVESVAGAAALAFDLWKRSSFPTANASSVTTRPSRRRLNESSLGGAHKETAS